VVRVEVGVIPFDMIGWTWKDFKAHQTDEIKFDDFGLNVAPPWGVCN